MSAIPLQRNSSFKKFIITRVKIIDSVSDLFSNSL